MLNSAVSSNRPITRLVVVWVLILPLFYLASRGHFWFQTTQETTFWGQSAIGDATVTANAYRIEPLLLGLICGIMLLTLPRVLRACLKDKVFAGLVMLALLSCAWSQFPFDCFKRSISLSVNTVFAFYLCQRFKPEEQLKMIYLLGWICLVFSTILALFFPRYGIDASHTWRGIYPYRNACAIPTAFFLSVAFFLPVKHLHASVVRSAYVMLSLVAMYMIHSATGWVLVVCIPIFWGIMKVFSKIAYRDKIPSFLIGAFVGLPVVGAVVSHAAEFTYLIGKDPTMSGRTAIWNAVIGAAMKRPILGCGYMSFFHGAQGENANLVISGSWNVSASHNGFLDMLVTLGAIGLALLLYSLFRAFKNGLLCLGGGATPYLSWCFCMIFLFVVVNMDEKAMMLPDDLIWVLYVIACVGLAEGAKGTRGRLARTDIEAFKSADMSVAD